MRARSSSKRIGRSLAGIRRSRSKTVCQELRRSRDRNALSPAIVATRAFYQRTAGSDSHRYVTLAAATLDQFPSQAEVNRLTRQVAIHGADPQVLRHVVLRLNPPGSKSPHPTGRPTATYQTLKQDVLINADYYSDTPSILGASLGFTHIIGVPGLNGTKGTDALRAVPAVRGRRSAVRRPVQPPCELTRRTSR